MTDDRADTGAAWFQGGGDLGALVRRHDWSATPLGPVERWPQALRGMVTMMLESPVPMCILWGRDLIQIYNDAYATIAAAKHPRALGMPTAICWPETWAVLGPAYEAVWQGQSQTFTDKKLTIWRHGRPEDAWFDLALSPLRDDTGEIGGVLGVVTETTVRVTVAEALAASERQVQLERGFLDTLIEHAPVGISIAQADTGRAVVLNRKAVELLGHEQPQTDIDRYAHYKAIHPDGRPYAVEDYPTVRVFRRGEAVEEEMIYRRPSGDVVRLGVSSAPVRDSETGDIRAAVTVFHDITERKRAEERQWLLLNELNHRVKNTLAAIQSIAQQTLYLSPSPEAFVTSFTHRLLALSQTHNLLTAGSWQSTELRSLLAAELAPYGSDDGGQASLGGPPVRVGAKAALSLGMAFHELATNAAKYGALSVPFGRVTVRWRWAETDPVADVKGDAAASDTETEGAAGAAPRSLWICWEEADGPPVAPPTRRGFGTRLIERGLAYDLNGTVTLDYRPTGLRCVIQFPVAPPGEEKEATP